jgi:DNA-binding MarR family transcriptional regulator
VSIVNSPQIAEPKPAPRVTYLVKRLELAVRARLDAVTSVHELTTPQYAALSALRLRPGISSAALARMSFVSAQAMNEMVVALAKKGLIERQPDPDHGKVLRIFLTHKGERALDACEAAVDEVEEEMLAHLDPAQTHALREALRLCSESLSAD